jgi:hypothetical protein
MQYLKVFKRWRQSKKTGKLVRNDLKIAYQRNPEHLGESWEAFLKSDLPVTLRKTSVKEPKAKVKVCRYADKEYIENVRRQAPTYLAI